MTESQSDKDQACEVPLIEQLRSIPKDFRAVRPIQWASDGTETGHQFIPVGHMMHRAADELAEAQQEVLKRVDNLGRLIASVSKTAPLGGKDATLLPGLREALKWKPNTPQLENAMTYAWESALKSFIGALERGQPLARSTPALKEPT